MKVVKKPSDYGSLWVDPWFTGLHPVSIDKIRSYLIRIHSELLMPTHVSRVAAWSTRSKHPCPRNPHYTVITSPPCSVQPRERAACSTDMRTSAENAIGSQATSADLPRREQRDDDSEDDEGAVGGGVWRPKAGLNPIAT